MKRKRSCPICGNSKGGGETLCKIEMKMPEYCNLPETYDIVCCGICGSCYANTSASADDYENYYKNHNIYGGWSCNSSSCHDYEIIARTLRRELEKDSRIADIGCGNGGLLSYLQKEGFTRLTGIDPSVHAIDELKKKSIHGVTGSIYSKPDDFKEKSDAVIFTMVLEHLLEPDKALEAIKTCYLKPGGLAVVTWPYFEDLIADNSPVINNFNHEHINYFSVSSADRLFGKFGFYRTAHHISLEQCTSNYIMFANIAAYRMDKGDAEFAQDVKDMKTKESILEYVHRLEKSEKNILSRISELAASKEETAVWGSGSYFMHLMAVSEISKCNIRFVVDNNRLKRNEKVYGYSVTGPEGIKNFDGTVIITSMLYGEEIERQIRNTGNRDCKIIRI